MHGARLEDIIRVAKMKILKKWIQPTTKSLENAMERNQRLNKFPDEDLSYRWKYWFLLNISKK